MDTNSLVTDTPQEVPPLVAEVPPQPKKPKTLLISAILFSIALLILGLLSFLDKQTGPGMAEAGACLDVASQEVAMTTTRMEATTDQAERIEIYCTEDTQSFEKLISCLETVRTNNSLSMTILNAFPKFSKQIQEVARQHNTICPNSPVLLP